MSLGRLPQATSTRPDRSRGPARDDDVLVLDPDPAAVSSARAFVLTHCRRAGLSEDTTDTVVLLTSEVVTNAVLHGRSQARLAITTARTATTAASTGAGAVAASVLVEVSDDNSRHPTLAPPDDAALDGRGMTMVDLLATAWGVRDEPLGKTVWFQLDATST